MRKKWKTGQFARVDGSTQVTHVPRSGSARWDRVANLDGKWQADTQCPDRNFGFTRQGYTHSLQTVGQHLSQIWSGDMAPDHTHFHWVKSYGIYCQTTLLHRSVSHNLRRNRLLFCPYMYDTNGASYALLKPGIGMRALLADMNFLVFVEFVHTTRFCAHCPVRPAPISLLNTSPVAVMVHRKPFFGSTWYRKILTFRICGCVPYNVRSHATYAKIATQAYTHRQSGGGRCCWGVG